MTTRLAHPLPNDVGMLSVEQADNRTARLSQRIEIGIHALQA